MISVVIPLYNKKKYIKNTIKSVLNQSFQDFEVIIVDDGSTDGSAQEVGKIVDSRIRLIRQNNAGVSAARNRGIQEAKFNLIAFLDADDEWKQEYLETQYNLSIKYPECSVFACNYEFKDSTGKIKPTIIKKLPFKEEDGILTNYFEVASCSHPPICSISIAVRKNAICKIGGFPLNVKSGEDILTWAKLACRYKIAYSKKSLATVNLADSHLIKNKPERLHDCNNIVDIEFEKLYLTNKSIKNLKAYIALWYKMRASVYMRLGDIIMTWKYSIKSLYYNCFNYKVYAFMLIVLMPKKFQKSIKSIYE